jgi:hypothetical protein
VQGANFTSSPRSTFSTYYCEKPLQGLSFSGCTAERNGELLSILLHAAVECWRFTNSFALML